LIKSTESSRATVPYLFTSAVLYRCQYVAEGKALAESVKTRGSYKLAARIIYAQLQYTYLLLVSGSSSSRAFEPIPAYDQLTRYLA